MLATSELNFSLRVLHWFQTCHQATGLKLEINAKCLKREALSLARQTWTMATLKNVFSLTFTFCFLAELKSSPRSNGVMQLLLERFFIRPKIGQLEQVHAR